MKHQQPATISFYQQKMGSFLWIGLLWLFVGIADIVNVPILHAASLLAMCGALWLMLRYQHAPMEDADEMGVANVNRACAKAFDLMTHGLLALAILDLAGTLLQAFKLEKLLPSFSLSAVLGILKIIFAGLHLAAWYNFSRYEKGDA